MQIIFSISVLLSAFCVLDYAKSEEYSSSKGYSLQYPEGWIIVSDSLQKDINGKLDLHSNIPDVTITEPNATIFASNINVVVAEGQIVVDTQAESEYMSQFKPGYEAQGITIKDFQVKQIQFSNRKALSATYRFFFPKVFNGEIRQWQVNVPGGGKTFIITFTALDAEFDKIRPIFEKTLDSLKIPAVTSGFFYQLSSPVRNTIITSLISGAIAGLVGGIIAVTRKRKDMTWLNKNG